MLCIYLSFHFKIKFLSDYKYFTFIWIVLICVRARLPGGPSSGTDDRDRNEHRPSELLAWNPRVPRWHHQECQASRRELQQENRTQRSSRRCFGHQRTRDPYWPAWGCKTNLYYISTPTYIFTLELDIY